MVKSLERTTSKWKSRVSVATPDYEEGVRNPSKDWQAKALAAKERYQAELQKAISEGRREKGISARGTAGWQSKTLGKSSRWSEGVSLAEAEFNSEMSKVLSFEQALQSKINSMPSATLEQRKAKAVAWIDGMAAYRKR